MKLSMCLIARDEAANLTETFDSFWAHVDEVVLVDTGSKDGTPKLAREYAKGKGEPKKLKLARMKWTGDFAAARTHADSLATGDWLAWADMDDTIEHASELRKIIKEQPADVNAVFFRYDYARDEHGNTVCELWRERLVRAGKGTWHGRVHECQALDGAITQVEPGRCQWVHRKQHGDPTTRNLDILERWLQDEPDNPRLLTYLGSERGAHGDHEGAVQALQAFLALNLPADDHRSQNQRKLAASLMVLGRHTEARAVAERAIGDAPQWPDSYLTLAEIDAHAHEWARAIHFAQRVLELGKPQTPLIVNPLDYTAAPLALIATCHAAAGRFDEALEYGQRALQVVPNHEGILVAMRDWGARGQREHAARTWAACASILIQHDEQLAALTLLEDTVPWFAKDHPIIVARRSELRERLAWVRDPKGYAEHYETGGSKPEDFLDDATSLQVAESLPRAQFLLAGLKAAA